MRRCGTIEGVCSYRPFRIVKFAVKSHATQSSVHRWCVAHAAELARVQEHKFSAGINLGKLVLQNVKEHDSDNSFERRVATQQSMGTSVGSKQHSRFFAKGLRKSMHAVLTSGFEKLLLQNDVATGRPPPFALIADKATINRQTGHRLGQRALIQTLPNAYLGHA